LEKTKEYIIKLTSNKKEHDTVYRIINNLSGAIQKELDGEMEFYTQPAKQPEYGRCLYGLESKTTLDKRVLKL